MPQHESRINNPPLPRAKLVQELVQTVLLELVAFHREDSQASAVAAALTMHNGLVVNETKACGGKSVELHHRDGLDHAAPRVLERLRRKGCRGALHKTAL